MNTAEYLVGVDVGGTNVRVVAADKDFIIAEKEAIRTDELTKRGHTVEALTDFIKAFTGSLPGDVLSISMGLPSTFNRERTMVFSTPNVTGLDNVPLVDLLERQFSLPVFIDKDACMLLYYDLHTNQIPNEGVILGFYLGTGIGNVIMIDGKLLLGKNGTAAELGHIPILGKDLLCTCGNVGCMEEYVGGKALVRLCNQYFPDIDIGNVFAKLSTNRRIMRFVEDMAVPIATEINIFDPDHVVIGGGVVAMKDFPRELLERSIRKHSRKPYPESNLSIAYSDNSTFGGALGAAIYGSYKR